MGVFGGSRSATRAWLVAGAWALLILVLASDSFSATATGGVLARILAELGAEVSKAALRVLHVLVRKGAHLVAYAGLGLLTARALARSVPLSRSLLWAWLLAICLALVDEGFQSTSAVRTGSLQDVGIDGFGALLGVAAYRIHALRKGAE